MSAKDERLTISPTSAVASPVLQSSTSGKPPSALSEQQPPSPSLPLVTQISTPQRERGRSLYPTTLAKSSQGQGPGGRIPLHRRGTSRTYERLEDLLREAGYKETRVFTPENERHKTGDGDGGDYDENGRRKQERKGSNVSAVVNFLSGLISTIPGTGIGIGGSSGASAESSSSTATSTGNSLRSQSQSTGETSIFEHKPVQAQDPGVIRLEDDFWAPPSPSPSSKPYSGQQQRQWHWQQSSSTNHHGSQSRTDTLKARPSPGTPQKRSLALDSLRRHSAAVVPATNSIPALANAPSSRSHPNISNLNNSSVEGHSARPQLKGSQATNSQSHAPLRHMTSAPSIPRPGSTPPIKQHKQIRRLTNADESTNAPPLPTNWLLNVAKAVMNANGDGVGTSTGVYIGGPMRVFSGSNTSLVSSSTAGGSGHGKLSRANSDSGRGRGRGRGRDHARVDRTGYVRPRGRLLNEEETKRLRPTTPLFDVKPGVLGENAVTTTNVNVVCRSAPASRATSRVRGGNGSRNQSRRRSKPRSDRNARERDNLPSLGVTTIEGANGADPSLLASLLLALPHTPNLNGRTMGVGGDDETSEDEDEDEGDIDLAKILVPSKRQRSVASLRRCLWGGGGAVLPSNADGGGGSRVFSRPQSRLGPGSYRPRYAKDGRWIYSWRSAASTSASQSQSSLEVEGSKQGYFSVPPSPASKGGRFGDVEAIVTVDPPGLGNRTSINPGLESLPVDKIHSSANSSNTHSRQHSRHHSASHSVAPSVSASTKKADTTPDPDDSFAQALERDFQRQRRGSIDMDEDEWRGLERLGLPGFGKESQKELKKRGAIPGWLWS